MPKKRRTFHLTMREFHEVNQTVGTVERALKADPKYRAWYKKHYPKSPYGKRY